MQWIDGDRLSEALRGGCLFDRNVRYLAVLNISVVSPARSSSTYLIKEVDRKAVFALESAALTLAKF